MKWMVEITDISTDQRLLSDILKGLKVELYTEDNITYLVSDQFDVESTSAEVWKIAKKMRDLIDEISKSTLGFKLGNLHEQKEDGSRNQHVFASGSLSTGSMSINSTVDITGEISEEERARSEAEHQDYQYQKKLAPLVRLVSACFRDERCLRVYLLLKQELTPPRMFNIFELIRDDLGKNLNRLASNNDLKRFKTSVNHQQVFGDESRHTASKEEPPPNPMSLEEAQDFISKIADSWFEQKCKKCIDDNNA